MKWFKHLVFLVFFVMFEFDTLNLSLIHIYRNHESRQSDVVGTVHELYS